MNRHEKSNAKKSSLLGVNISTATARLRKQLLFHYVMLANKHYCFRCGAEIDNIDDFSIEHCAPWMQADDAVGAFFDLNNIAFSHLSCNIAHGSGGYSKIHDNLKEAGKVREARRHERYWTDPVYREHVKHRRRLAYAKRKNNPA
jgi:hypothetical protein